MLLNLCNAIIHIFINKMVRRTCLHLIIKVLVVFLIVCGVILFFLTDFIVKLRHDIISDSGYIKGTVQIEEKFRKNTTFEFIPSKCDTLHVGMMVFDSNAIVNVYTVFKSILFYRSNPLHLHLLVDIKTEYILKYLFETWSISQLNVSYYYKNNNLNFKNYNKTLIALPALLSNSGIEKIIIINSDQIFTDNIYKLWILFDNFSKTQFLGIIDIENNGIRYKSTKRNQILLFKLKNFPTKNFKTLPSATTNSNFYYTVFCKNFNQNRHDCYDSESMSFQWNTEFSKNSRLDYTFFLKYDGTLLREKDGVCGKSVKILKSEKKNVKLNCSEFFGNNISPHWRTLLFFQDSNFSVVENDVTLVSQLSYDRINLLDELQRSWDGPIALSLYAADSEMNDILRYIKKIKLLHNNSNIVFHIVFKEESQSYPINVLRNAALKNVVTPYVFLVDIDFIPSQNLYINLKYHLNNTKNTNKKAFIVPAFETVKNTIPKTKFELVAMLIAKTITPFHYKTYPAAHEPTNYPKWILATEPYNAHWNNRFEPYLVVQKNVTPYDTRFFGYGWNKVSHIMELHKQKYQFVVLPNSFIVHKNHKLSKEKRKLLLSANYQLCLKDMKIDFIRDINRKYKMVH